MVELREDQAISLFKSEIWKDWSHEETVQFQLFQDCLCMPFSRFHTAMNSVLGRLVTWPEFANKKVLIEEYFGTKEPPTFQEIIEMIPKGSRVLVDMTKPKLNPSNN